MATTHGRTSVSTDGGSFYTVYTNSTSKPQRIIVTDVHFAGDANYYGNNINYFETWITKRGATSTMNSVVMYGVTMYSYSLYANFTGSHGHGFIGPDASYPGSTHFIHYGQGYANTPFSSTSYVLTSYTSASQQQARGPGQCVLYPSDSIRVGANKVGTLYTDFLIMAE